MTLKRSEYPTERKLLYYQVYIIHSNEGKVSRLPVAGGDHVPVFKRRTEFVPISMAVSGDVLFVVSELNRDITKVTSNVFYYDICLSYRVRYYWGRVLNFDQSESRKHSFLASNWLKFETLPRKYRTL